jgi:superfamily II DNA/RNA helicase
MSFDAYGLPPSILKNLKLLGFERPTAIQAKAIPVGLEGRDVLGRAQTGTGKTAAFSIPLLVRLNARPGRTALILAPTRELAMQIHKFLKDVAGKNISLRSVLLIGGASMNQQIRELNDRPRIFVATPGRLVDHLRRQSRLLSSCDLLVLDEADRMLDMGFLPQLKTIQRHLPRERQTLMFSATYGPTEKRLATEWLKNPAEISIGENAKPIAAIEQEVVQTTHKEKNDVLLDQLNAREGSVLIFTRTKHRTDRLAKFLDSYGYAVARIHGNRSQGQRRVAIENFRNGRARILVATDIAARGLDIESIAHVINYDLPQVPEDYVHRIGRTGRNGRSGRALCLLTPDDRGQWRSISKLVGATNPSLGHR